MPSAKHYDVFISHRSENKPWVRVLEENLSAQGFSPFLDERSMIPGGSVAGQLHQALEHSANGILVATPESLESGWVQNEYEKMLGRRNNNPGFRIIPLIFGSIPNFPFLDNLLCVDFADPSPTAYRNALYRVVCGLRNQPPENQVELAAEPEVPEPLVPRYREMPVPPLAHSEELFLDEVFETLNSDQPVMLLVQAGRDKAAMYRAILEEIQGRLARENVLHLVPLGQEEVNEGDYFNYLARQCRATQPVTTAPQFEFMLDDRLRPGAPLFILLTRLEDGDPDHRIHLARTLRNLSERYPGQLQLLFCGSEHLMALRFRTGNLSPLNNAEQLFWPEPDQAEIAAQSGSDEPLGEAATRSILDLCGGHPGLIRKALRLWRRQPGMTVEILANRLLQETSVTAPFVRQRESGGAEQLRGWLEDETTLGSYQHWPADTRLRCLFWDNLLVNRGGRFAWRCELIRRIGREVLAC